MANKVISITSNSKKVRKDNSINDYKVINDISANNDYVYMDIDMVAQYKRAAVVNLSSICQYDYILGTETYRNQQYPISALDNEDEMIKILLYSRSSLNVTKKIDNFIKSLKSKPIDYSKVSYDEEHKVYVYRY